MVEYRFCWKPQHVVVNILLSQHQVVYFYVKDKYSRFAYYTTYIYGYNTLVGSKQIWEQLKVISNSMTKSCVVLGDFNTIRSVHDRVNGAPIKQIETQDVQDCIDEVGLGQIRRKGCPFSWTNKRDPEDRIYSLIEWDFGKAQWFNNHSSLEASYLNPGCSNHSPILISTIVPRQRLPKPFRLLNVLLQ